MDEARKQKILVMCKLTEGQTICPCISKELFVERCQDGWDTEIAARMPANGTCEENCRALG